MPKPIDPSQVVGFEPKLNAYLKEGFEVVSDGPSGVQLRGPKKMRRQTKVAMLFGAVMVFVYGIGVIILLFALIDHAMAKQPTVFIPR